jgi:N-acetyl-anhydromuramyl-L-alanine amidase AmpD
MYFKTAPLPIKDLPANSGHLTPGILVPKVIILHATAGSDSREWLTTNPRSVVSIHRLIMKDGLIYKIAENREICNHVGFSQIGRRRNLNPIALGIEFENLNDGKDPYPMLQLDAGAAQVVEWWGQYGFLPMLPHSMVDAPETSGGTKTDPRGFPWQLFNERIWVHLALAAKAAGI